MSEVQNHLGEKFKETIAEAMKTGDFRALNTLVSDTVNDALREADFQANLSREAAEKRVWNSQRSWQDKKREEEKSEDHQRLIHIGYRRADQFAVSGKQPCDISLFLCFVYDIHFHIIPYEGFSVVLTEDTFCLAFIDSVRTMQCIPRMDVIEAGNSFYNLALHSSCLCIIPSRIPLFG